MNQLPIASSSSSSSIASTSMPLPATAVASGTSAIPSTAIIRQTAAVAQPIMVASSSNTELENLRSEIRRLTTKVGVLEKYEEDVQPYLAETIFDHIEYGKVSSKRLKYFFFDNNVHPKLILNFGNYAKHMYEQKYIPDWDNDTKITVTKIQLQSLTVFKIMTNYFDPTVEYVECYYINSVGRIYRKQGYVEPKILEQIKTALTIFEKNKASTATATAPAQQQPQKN